MTKHREINDLDLILKFGEQSLQIHEINKKEKEAIEKENENEKIEEQDKNLTVQNLNEIRLNKQIQLTALRKNLIAELDDLYLFTTNLSKKAYFSSEDQSENIGIFGFANKNKKKNKKKNKPKEVVPLPRHKQKIVTKRADPPLSLRKKLDTPNNIPAYITL